MPHPAKRRRAPTNPLEGANRKTDAQFIEGYMRQSTNGTPWFPEWTHPRTGAVYRVSLHRPSNLSPADLQACFALIEETSRPDYEASPGRWRPAAKRKEMRSPDLRYVLVRDVDGEVRAFTSLMPTFEDGRPVVYCYEIHLKTELQSTGLGAKLMGLHIAVAESLPPIEKVMLTCFVANRRAMAFYARLGFERDEFSPDAKILRSGETRAPDYVILSKPVKRVAISGKELDAGSTEVETNGFVGSRTSMGVGDGL